MKGPFTEKARRAIQNAQDAAVSMGQAYVGTEHLLLGLAQTHDGIAAKALQNQGVSPEDIAQRIGGAVPQQGVPGATPQDFTPRAKRIFEISQQEAARMHTGYIGTEHLLIALLKEH